MARRRVLFPVPGQMFDVSLVNARKATQRDPDALIEAVKAEEIAAAAEDAEYADYLADLLDCDAIEPEPEAEESAKAKFTADERKSLADKGEAMPGGGFPIRNARDLKNAMRAIGRAKNPTATKAWIRKRAAALGLTAMLTEAFKAEEVTPPDAEGEKAKAPAISHEERDRKVNRALTQMASQGIYGYLEPLEHHDDHVIAKDYGSGDTYKIPHTTDEDGAVTLGTPQKVRAQYEAAKAGAEFSAKNRDILSRIKGVLGRLLGEEAQEPEHADIKSELEQAESLLEGKKAEPTAATEDEDMTVEEMAALLDSKLAPLNERLSAVESAKAVATPDADAAKAAAEAAALEEARKARPAAASPEAIRLAPLEANRAKLREVGKARKLEDRLNLVEAMRVLSNRDTITGRYIDR